MRDAEWRQIPGFTNYWVSDDGRVINMATKHVMNGTDNGYFKSVMLSREGKKYNRSIPKLQELAFWFDKETTGEHKTQEEQP